MTLEREVKLAAAPAFRVPDLSGVLPGVRAPRRPDRTIDAVYIDTPDLRLARWGASLRYREGEGWTAKLPRGDEGDLLAREEIEFPSHDPIVPPEALDLLHAYLRSEDVQPVARLRTFRRTLELRNADDRRLGEVVVDDVTVLGDPRVAVHFRELEVELLPGSPSELAGAVVARLRAAGAGPPEPTAKVTRALGPAATAPPDVLAGDLPSEPTAGQVVRRAIAASVVQLLRNDAVVRLDADPEGVHQARVATRRLRSDLRTFGPLLSLAWADELRGELRWLAEVLGQARDADVLLDRVRARVAPLRDTEAPAGAHVVESLERSDKEAHAALMEALRSERYTAILNRLVEAANSPALLPQSAGRAADVLPGLVVDPWRALEASVRSAERDPSDRTLHGVRIRAKRCRYATEAVAPVLGKAARRFARSLADLQTLLGEHQDAVVAESWLRDWAAGQDSADVAFTAGVLAGVERAAAAGARERWHEVWRAIDHKELRSWM